MFPVSDFSLYKRLKLLASTQNTPALVTFGLTLLLFSKRVSTAFFAFFFLVSFAAISFFRFIRRPLAKKNGYCFYRRLETEPSCFQTLETH